MNLVRSRRLAALASVALVADPVGAGLTGISALVLAGAALTPVETEAAPPRRGGGARANPPPRPSASMRPGGGGAGRPAVRGGSTSNINHNTRNNANINVNNVNVNRNVNVNGGYYGGGYDHYDDWDDHYHPVAVAATVAVTAAVVGSIVRSVPPSCSTVIVNGVSYSQCGNTWYQPQYLGSSVQYVVVNPPR